ncbi:hypothetical protein PTSG_03087 [Salpingoeca rosetta]|uniref:HpcH/HpaI aldolase/citrate lyase domain-containing protein n=1 Tax=Salpingoeca rosetta (strain ATCC 50818 / BSB-021) TaxID=946362 RepID=F2U475_SALR5|nr:uncharacterized protein PTSG_03087 [Salpingoeca rosetta]EGD82441.1 hypothetical protein PTSG_03087 [Salpingoeca rosetta]|eukprot:XP_004995677.1 hypothetical protein PTSG_03087 [Salpingoeca rosetta]
MAGVTRATGTLLLGSCSTLARAVSASPGLSFCLVDLQHGAASMNGLAALVNSVNGNGLPCITRVLDPGDMATLGRALDLGSSAVVVPGVSTADHAQAIADAARYPPDGFRSWGPLPASRPPFTIRNQAITHIGMIENKFGVDAITDIAKTELDAIYIGPTDLSFSITGTASPPKDNKQVQEAIQHIAATCQAAGKPVGVHCTHAHALHKLEKGTGVAFDFVTVGSDMSMMQDALSSAIARVQSGEEDETSADGGGGGDGGRGGLTAEEEAEQLALLERELDPQRIAAILQRAMEDDAFDVKTSGSADRRHGRRPH